MSAVDQPLSAWSPETVDGGLASRPRRRVWRLFPLAAMACLTCSPALLAAGGEVSASSAADGAAHPAMPERERAFIELLLEARRRCEAAAPGPARQQSRLEMQIRVTRFMNELQDVDDWVGIVRSSHTNREGDRWIRIEIAPGIVVTTGENRLNDPNLITLIEPHSPIYAAIDSLGVGQPVVFSGRILTGRLSTDDDMVERPQLYARFSSLKAAD